MKVLFLFILSLLFSGVQAQVKDSFQGSRAVTQVKKDSDKKRATVTVTRKEDSVKKNITDTVKEHTSAADSSGRIESVNSPRTVFTRKPVSEREALSFYLPDKFYHKGVHYDTSLISFHKDSQTNDAVFYCLVGILLILGIIKTSFPKYFKHLFQFILQPTLRKRNMKEGVNTENAVPSVLFNLIFIITASLYIILPGNPGFAADDGKKYWMYCALALLGIYCVKYIVIKISGWIFNAQPAANIYNYVVFSVNKILGVILIPVIVLMVYGNPSFTENVYSGAVFVVIGLLLYRYAVSFILMRGELKVSILHFFLYLCAIEILPLLIIYKILLMKFGKIL